MSFRLRLQQKINHHVSYLQKLKFRKFATGAAFGGLLAIFAFGSMGMRADMEIPAVISPLNQLPAAEFYKPFALSFEADLKGIRRKLDPHRQAGLAEITNAVDLLIRHLRPIAIKTGAIRLPAESAGFYTKALHNFSKTKNMTRGSTTMILFHFLSDLLDLQYRDFSQEGAYSDIPRFHFLTVPANALNSLGVKIARNAETFGVTDQLSVGQLLDIVRDVMLVAETSFEEKS
ncbi:MAG: hypothetical protein KKB51_12405 [Candidatus Riflebacteria bacterium]|nr:hypothetical protein [Candidatus Riflebacteria bacterium]